MRRSQFTIGVLISLLAAAGPANAQTVKVASKNYTESIIAAHMMADVLEDAGIKVERKIGLGGTGVIHQALVSGEIDLAPSGV